MQVHACIIRKTMHNASMTTELQVLAGFDPLVAGFENLSGRFCDPV
jgi:hypothetical protein